MQVIIIAGCVGFIGSNFIPYFLKENIEYRVVTLDIRKYT
jgi:dTDP-glucose 4,6-dehydratase